MAYRGPRGPIPQNVLRQKNIIKILALKSSRDVSDFLRAIEAIIHQGYQDVILDLGDVGQVFPIGCVPIAALIQHYRETGLDVTIHSGPRIIGIAHLAQPLMATPDGLRREIDPLSRVWQFQDENMVNELVTAFVTAIMERLECSAGVREAFE